MKFTDQQLDAYMNGRLKLHTNRAGKTTLMPSKPRPNDKGITPPEKRAYWRVWYLKNRAKRLAYSSKRYGKGLHPDAKTKVVLSNPSKHEFKVGPMTKAERKIAKAAYAARWRAKNRKAQLAYGKKMYHLKYSTAAKRRIAQAQAPAVVWVRAPKPTHQPKKTLLQRILGIF